MSSITEEIKARLDIVTYVGQYVPLKKSGRYYKACCPFHSENTPSFIVNPDTQSWRCFGACAEGGDIFNFAMKQNGWTFPEALQELGNQAGVEVRKQSPQQRQQSERLDKLRGILQTAADMFHQNLTQPQDDGARAALQYARQKRGFTDETIAAFAIGYAPPGWQNMLNDLTHLGYEQDDIIEVGLAKQNDRGRVYDAFRNRLLIPIRDERGRVVGFGARALDPEDNPKYLNSPQTTVFDKSKLLFGLDRAKQTIRDGETAVIVEGYMDVVQAHQAGFTNVVAQMGTAMTENQLKRLAPRYAKKIILALDADAAGQNATRRSLETIRNVLSADAKGQTDLDIRVLQIPGAKDPDDLLREKPDEWQRLVDQAISVTDFIMSSFLSGLSSDATPQEREAVARQIISYIVDSTSSMYERELVFRMSNRLHFTDAVLSSWISEQSLKNEKTRRKSNLEEPPPIDYDSIEPPPDDDGAVEPAAAPLPTDELEHDCLRSLLADPDALYRINRHFRELAGDNPHLRRGPLSDFGVADFSREDYRTIMRTLAEAVNQHDQDVLDFVRQSLAAELHRQLDSLLVMPRDEVFKRLHQRYTADFAAIWKQHERLRPRQQAAADLLEKSVRLRLRRINREIDEYSFLQVDAQNNGDMETVLKLGQGIVVSKQAREILDAAHHEHLMQFT